MPRGIPGSGPNAGRTRTKATKTPTRKSKDTTNGAPARGRKASNSTARATRTITRTTAKAR